MFRSVVLLFLFVHCVLMAPSHSTFAQDSLGIGTVEYADTQIAVMSGVVDDGHVWEDVRKKWVHA